MPRAHERRRRRAAGLCVECWTPSASARCPKCKEKERLRAKGGRGWQQVVRGDGTKLPGSIDLRPKGWGKWTGGRDS